MSWKATEPNGRGNGWKIGPLWLGVDTHSMESRDIAHMVSAAPEMFDVLERLEESAEYWSEYGVPIGIVADIRAALKKARGK